jgi:hypothetical protein
LKQDPSTSSEEIPEDSPTYYLDADRESSTLLVSLSVFPAPGGKSAFDFVRAAGPVNVKKMFVRDPNMLWYQKGTPGLGTDVPSMVEGLRSVITAQHVQRTVMIGNSGGGFAAILFGVLLGVDEIHAFNPPTLIHTPADTSMPDRLLVLERELGLESPYLDLRKVLSQSLQDRTRIFVHYSRGDRKDKRHARYISSCPHVTIIEYPSVSHHVARFFAKRAMLSPLLQAIADGNAGALSDITRHMKMVAAPWYLPGLAWRLVTRVWRKLGRVLCGNRHSV